MKNSKYSPRFLFFLGLAGILLLVNLLIANDYMTIWQGAETDMLLHAQQRAQAGGSAGATDLAMLPSWVLDLVYSNTGFRIAYLRYISVIVLLLSFLGIYHWGRKIFGEDTVILTLLVASASFMLVNVAKLVTADVWLFGAQALYLIFLILYIKQPVLKWLAGTLICFALGMLIQLPSMLVWSLGLGAYFFFLHPNQKNSRRAFLKFILPLGLLGLVYYVAQSSGDNFSFLFAYGNMGYGKYLIVSFLAVLPWLGFLTAGLVDVFMKIKKREELAIISIGWLVFGLASMSMVVQLLFAYLTAKHIIAFLRKPYPYNGVVKSVSLFMLILSFVVITLMLIGGWQQLGAGGFQSSLAFGVFYWVFGFVGCMGLFLGEKRFIIGGFALSALLVTFAFWGKMYPLIEKFRELPRQLVEVSKKQSGGEALPLSVAMNGLEERSDFKVYANAGFTNWQALKTQKEVDEILKTVRPQVLIIEESDAWQVDSTLMQKGEKVVGNLEVSQAPETFWIIRLP